MGEQRKSMLLEKMMDGWNGDSLIEEKMKWKLIDKDKWKRLGWMKKRGDIYKKMNK